MKKLYSALAGVAVVSMAASAQQLPNVGFEGDWVDSRPWSSITDTLTFINATLGMDYLYPNGIFGLTPQAWTISNVNGVVSEKSDDAGNSLGLAGLGATEVGRRVEGFNSASAVQLKNTPNPFMATQIVPGYITLGKSWATNGLDIFTFTPTDMDGGSFGGIDLSNCPDELAFMYKFIPVDGVDGQKATALFYAWKGSWKQEAVPANNTMGNPAVTVDMTDRDRNILGIETLLGGAVTKTDDAELIAKGLAYIEEPAADWTAYNLPIEYLSDATPEKINVVLSANDYFDSENIVNGTTLVVDDVKLIYNSTLSSLTVGGVAIDLVPGVYDYDVNAEYTGIEGISYTVKGRMAKAEILANDNDKAVTIHVAGAGADHDGLTEHSYNITFANAATATSEYKGFVTIDMGTGDITDGGMAANLLITHNPGEPTCNFLLPNFTLDMGSGPMVLGDIAVDNVDVVENANGSKAYTGHVDGLSLLGGAIVANVDVNGTISADGICDFDINVVWNNIPIAVKFTTFQPGTLSYSGKLTIFLFGGEITGGGMNATIQIHQPAGASTCTFTLPDFQLAMEGSDPVPMGDIVVEDVAVTDEADGAKSYKGSVKGLELAEGQLIADVDLTGTISASGDCDFDINVIWEGTPITVKFVSGSTAINGVEADTNAPVEYFDIRGNRVNADSLTGGIYIRRQGTTVSKIVVR